MTDILPPLHGPKIDKILGKGSVALITDEVLIGLTPTRVNSVDNCISIKIADSQGCCNVFPGMPKREMMELVHQLDEDGSDAFLTMPMCVRSRAEAWRAAADVLEAAAKACGEMADLAKDAK